MADGRSRWERDNNVARTMLAAGQITNVDRYLQHGHVAPPAPPPVDEKDLEYDRCLRANGRFMKPDEVEKWLAENPRKT